MLALEGGDHERHGVDARIALDGDVDAHGFDEHMGLAFKIWSESF